MKLKTSKTNRFILLELLGMKCRMCPEKRPEKLDIDHIYNDGQQKRTTYGSSEKIYSYYLQDELLAYKRLQPLCKNCHNIKTWTTNDFHPQDLLSDPPSKNQALMKLIKNLEGSNKNPVKETHLIKLMKDSKLFSGEETRNYIRRMIREASIYESKPGCYNTV